MKSGWLIRCFIYSPRDSNYPVGGISDNIQAINVCHCLASVHSDNASGKSQMSSNPNVRTRQTLTALDLMYKEFKINLYKTTSRCWTTASLYALKCKRFRNTRHTLTFGIPLQRSFWNTLHYQWKPHWTVTILGKTQWAATLYQFKTLYMSLWINSNTLSKL
jgi:hypothetical protein